MTRLKAKKRSAQEVADRYHTWFEALARSNTPHPDVASGRVPAGVAADLAQVLHNEAAWVPGPH